MTNLPFFTELLKKHVLSFVEGAAAPAPELPAFVAETTSAE
jgi:hypothetical protein